MPRTEFYVTVGLWIKAEDAIDARQKTIDMISTEPISVAKFEPLLDWEIVEIE
jgi:hypothetical protein